MWPKTADLVTFTEEILNGKLQFLSNVYNINSLKGRDVNFSQVKWGWNASLRTVHLISMHARK